MKKLTLKVSEQNCSAIIAEKLCDVLYLYTPNNHSDSEYVKISMANLSIIIKMLNTFHNGSSAVFLVYAYDVNGDGSDARFIYSQAIQWDITKPTIDEQLMTFILFLATALSDMANSLNLKDDFYVNIDYNLEEGSNASKKFISKKEMNYYNDDDSIETLYSYIMSHLDSENNCMLVKTYLKIQPGEDEKPISSEYSVKIQYANIFSRDTYSFAVNFAGDHYTEFGLLKKDAEKFLINILAKFLQVSKFACFEDEIGTVILYDEAKETRYV